MTQRVLAGNPDLQVTALARDAARSASTAALALPNPKLDVSGGRAAPRASIGGSSSVQAFG
ncbi:MAG: TolC family protein, partial [Betaproteobacteria bacterium]|nr:TolC family protein [Betaproteobacteria bacterium]